MLRFVFIPFECDAQRGAIRARPCGLCHTLGQLSVCSRSLVASRVNRARVFLSVRLLRHQWKIKWNRGRCLERSQTRTALE